MCLLLFAPLFLRLVASAAVGGLGPVELPFQIFIKADELAKELDISQGLAYKMIAQWNEELRAKGYTTVGGRVSRRYYQEKIYGAGEE